jgi:cystinosin
MDEKSDDHLVSRDQAQPILNRIVQFHFANRNTQHPTPITRNNTQSLTPWKQRVAPRRTTASNLSYSHREETSQISECYFCCVAREIMSQDPNSDITPPQSSSHQLDEDIRHVHGSSSARRLDQALSLMASTLTDDTGGCRLVSAGLLSLFLIGATIGVATPKNHSLPNAWYQYVSAAIGYIYFLAWSVSFYPQVVSNFKRQSTVGLSSDFAVLNVLGFACYAAYNASFFWSSTIQDMYHQKYGQDAEITVQSNDVAFALHALILSSVTALQIVFYGGGMNALRLSKPISLVIASILTICAVYPVLLWLTHDSKKFNWLDFLYMLSYVKVGISLIKYIPQVVLNIQRKSTVGWSIWNILLDFTGGCLSILQLIGDCADRHDFSGITGNPAKFGLGFVSIFFDVIFIFQHYYVYASTAGSVTADTLDEQQEPLLQAHGRSDQDEAEAEAHNPTYQPETILVQSFQINN